MKFPTIKEMAEEVAEKALDEWEYKGKTLRRWVEIILATKHGTNLAEVGTDCISRQQAIDAVNGLIDRFEQILRDIREANGDDSVCGMCEYDGAYIGQSGDWCNECPGFDKEDCFKLSDKCRKRWLESVKLPSAQPEINCSEFPNSSDTISRQGYTEEELRVFQHGISLSLLSKRSAQHWRYDEDTATEIEFLERLYDKVSADMKGGQG